ncbi:Flagellar biosynthesis protein FlhA [Magnetospirillum sp. LM-5]|uniref:flagellar biosynthesis protein FlhA n=1 Tax=Magnetospirillum sp. LM-5 TaxID=2681466 RepID=UPI001383DD11|nr:flagellar biosynthesis protein FlhA [Magnetospirillum sp. LM-5]CAA7616503.1 Flagellar biosynthesis protein FlhA [Magnetospirillum sp. LM-5]
MADGAPSPGNLAANDTAQAAWSRFNKALRRGDVILAIGVVAIMLMLILPLPSWLLDMGLALSVTVSVLILMVSLFIEKPLQFSSFPTVLLLTTLIRLSLNLASTRLILGHGHEGPEGAGQVIAAFASFIMSGNFVIGIIVFIILVIVNFVVITKGSGRIAEVAARFTLDGLPGKQMAIDADLSAGLIDEQTAKKRRSELEQESQFFGAMDGASKFVRGDAIAGLLITGINIIAGMIIGMAQNNLTFAQAADIYTKLTVGDGLVTQVPALLVSVAAGILVTKAGVTDTVDKALSTQLGGYPRAMGTAAGLITMMAIVPGMPFLPFFMLGGGMGLAAYFVDKQQRIKVERETIEAEEKARQTTPVAEEPISTALRIDTVRLELGYGLLQMINNPKGVKLTDQIKSLRRAMASEVGFVMPSVRIQDNMQLPANAYVVYIKEVESGRGDLRPNHLLIMDPRGDEITLPGEKTKEPTFGLPAMWVEPTNREEALFRGYTVVDPPTVVTTHLTEVIKDNMAEMLSHSETQKLLDEMDKEHQKLIAELIPAQITIGGLQRVLQNLLTERISIRDLPTILEGVAEACGHTRNVTMITEHVRARLARQISDSNTGPQGFIPLITLSPEWEQAFAESLVGQGEEKQLSMPPSQLQDFITRTRQSFERFAMQGETPVLLTSPMVRPYVRSIIERFRPVTVVMSQAEIHPKAKIKTMGQI